jgi:hypothetical protein
VWEAGTCHPQTNHVKRPIRTIAPTVQGTYGACTTRAGQVQQRAMHMDTTVNQTNRRVPRARVFGVPVLSALILGLLLIL